MLESFGDQLELMRLECRRYQQKPISLHADIFCTNQI